MIKDEQRVTQASKENKKSADTDTARRVSSKKK